MKIILTEQQTDLVNSLLKEDMKFKRHLFLEFYNRVPYFKERYNVENIGKIQDEGIYIEILFLEDKFERFNYLIDSIERNAYIGQLRAELDRKGFEMEDGDTCWQIFKKTKSYQKYLYLENFVEQLKQITSEEYQRMLIDDYNISNAADITTYSQLLKKVTYKWQKYKKKYINTACKIIYDVFIEYKLMIK